MNRWNRCIKQEGPDLDEFLHNFLDRPERSLLLIAGAGFDPRSTSVAMLLSAMTQPKTRGLFIREQRPTAFAELQRSADENTERLRHCIRDCTVAEIPIFIEGNAVVGGRETAKLLANQELDGITDVLLDISALSTGVYFPATKMLLDAAQRGRGFNVHIFVTEEPAKDHGIVGVACDRATPVHGFKGRIGLDEVTNHARLWLPQLVPHRRQSLERIHTAVSPDDVCPILPFPCSNPRLPDMLVEEFRETLAAWSVDLRNFVYAAENDPLDLYRTILRIVDTRDRIFASAGGSLVTLSPSGSKLLSIGALLAALERDLPVMYVESIGYDIIKENGLNSDHHDEKIVHLWLHGEAYPPGSKN